MFCVHDVLKRRMGGPGRKLLVVAYKNLPDNMLAAIEEDDFSTFLLNDAKVQDYARSLVEQRYQPRRLEFVLAKNVKTSRWYRCTYMEEKIGLARVYAIDWCFEFFTTMENIRVCEIHFISK